MDTRLANHRAVWEAKPVLRLVYGDYYRRIFKLCCDGPTLEIGSGIGNIKDLYPEVISMDILFAHWLDFIADAQQLPVNNAAFQNIVMFDVLHHIECPKLFFKEAMRILRPGGRIVVLEPAITPVSWFFYHFFHHEEVNLKTNPLEKNVVSNTRDPLDSNQAVPTLLFGRYLGDFAREFPELAVRKREWLSLIAYPLSGGFQPWSLIPQGLVGPVLKFEDCLVPLLGRLMAFRLLVVVDKEL